MLAMVVVCRERSSTESNRINEQGRRRSVRFRMGQVNGLVVIDGVSKLGNDSSALQLRHLDDIGCERPSNVLGSKDAQRLLQACRSDGDTCSLPNPRCDGGDEFRLYADIRASQVADEIHQRLRQFIAAYVCQEIEPHLWIGIPCEGAPNRGCIEAQNGRVPA